MAESKILEQDKDEWIYHSMNKYTNLYMFELEYPLDALEIINETSLCVAGIQEYSKKCELLQLCVPPKLLSSEDEEGLCKDRDFKILSGGYADGRVRQIKFIRESSNLVATCQDGYGGVFIYEVGDDNRATILERQSLSTGTESSSIPTSLYCMKNRIFLGSKSPLNEVSSDSDSENCIILHEWVTDTSFPTPVKTHSIWKSSPLRLGHIHKIREWDENTITFLTSTGTVALYDLRSSTGTPEIFMHATKSPNSSTSASSSPAPVIFSFDVIPGRNKIGVIDSCGGYEVFDARCVTGAGSEDAKSKSMSMSCKRMRSLLPEVAGCGGAYPDYFNIEYEQREKDVDSCRFIISGVKGECVPVYQEEHQQQQNYCDRDYLTSEEEGEKQLELASPIFSHDGHSKPVTHSMWHPLSNNLIFSASADAVLHAWQFIPDSNSDKQEDNN